MDNIIVSGLTVMGKHGVLPEEKVSDQPFVVSIKATIDLTKASSSDSLLDTVDYVEIRNKIISTVNKNSFNLLEKLADSIAKNILTDTRITAITVSVQKPQIFKDATVGVEIYREN